jgi:hypothetical protein
MSFDAVLERLQKLENPYPGLRSFETGEEHLFFGRDQQIAELLARLIRDRFVAVIGVSGSGKSSLVRAGVIPALQRSYISGLDYRWRVAVIRPAGSPFESLADALGANAALLRESSYGLLQFARQLPPEERLLLVVDQFEELFRYKEQEAATDEAKRNRDITATEAAEFVQLLLTSSRNQPPVHVIITMRSDYLGDCAEFRDFPEALNDSQYLVPRMTRDQRQQAIESPLGRVGISSSLVQRMLNDAGDQPDQLPVLQHALARTWSRWSKASSGSGKIELADYQAIGGFEKALNDHANELLQAPVIAQNPKIVETIFKRLTARGRNNRERRDPATLAELWALCGATTVEQRNQVVAVIDHFRQDEATFLTPRTGPLAPDTYIDITHESLIRQWNQLANVWLPEEQASAKTFLNLLERAKKWKEQGGEVLIGLDLNEAVAWNLKSNKTDTWAQHYADEPALGMVLEFINASSDARERAARKERTARMQWRLLWALLGALVVGFIIFGYWEEKRNQEQLSAALEKYNEDLRDTSWSIAARAKVTHAEAARLDTSGTTIQYFAKKAELESNPNLIPSWKKLGFKVEQKPANWELPSNKIWYGSKVDAKLVRLVAYSLLGTGIALRQIEPLSKSNLDQGREHVIQVGWSSQATNLPLIKSDAVDKFEVAQSPPVKPSSQ